MLQQANFGDTKTRGRARSPLLERYTRTFFRALNQKIPSELLPPAAADCATGKIDPKNEDDEDEKVSTETGQVHSVDSLRSRPTTFPFVPTRSESRSRIPCGPQPMSIARSPGRILS
jgi:hypothetical protein